MWTRCGSSWLWFLTFLSRRVLADEPVDGYVGEPVLLPCTGPLTSTAQPTVYWRFGDDWNVYDVIKGVEDLQNQHPQFKGRAEHFPAEYSRGNFSLLLTNVHSTDAGRYLCYILNYGLSHEIILQVKAKPTTDVKIDEITGGTDERTPKMALILASLLGAAFPHISR